MEAKDTVKYPPNSQILPEIAVYQNALLLEQAEISFEAGMRTVVEWIEKHDHSTCMDCSCGFDFRLDEWQAQLKEWNISA